MDRVADQQHPISVYLKIWGFLFVLSAASYLVDYFNIEGYLRWFLIILFMLLKAGLIVAIFMHMFWERLALIYAITVPPVLILVFVAIMVFESNYTLSTRTLFFGLAAPVNKAGLDGGFGSRLILAVASILGGFGLWVAASVGRPKLRLTEAGQIINQLLIVAGVAAVLAGILAGKGALSGQSDIQLILASILILGGCGLWAAASNTWQGGHLQEPAGYAQNTSHVVDINVSNRGTSAPIRGFIQRFYKDKTYRFYDDGHVEIESGGARVVTFTSEAEARAAIDTSWYAF